jgi:hypothetical protein
MIALLMQVISLIAFSSIFFLFFFIIFIHSVVYIYIVNSNEDMLMIWDLGNKEGNKFA